MTRPARSITTCCCSWRTGRPRAGTHGARCCARAIENLCYVAGVNRAGTDGNGIAYAGDSVVADYLGMPIVELDDQPQVATVSLSATALREHRERFPAQLDADAFTLDR